MTMPKDGFIPEWQLPQHVKSFVTYRTGGVSKGAYANFNLADHVGDNQQHVEQNRKALMRILDLPQVPIWLEQVHGNRVVNGNTTVQRPAADAIYTDSPNIVCAILTADCLPILLCSDDGAEVAAVHAGWKGLLNGIIAATLENFSAPNKQISAYIGPAIGAKNYEVGTELKERFAATDAMYKSAFYDDAALAPGKVFMALEEIAQIQLSQLGLEKIWASDICTFEHRERFYSYRRDGVSGRFASLIWRSE